MYFLLKMVILVIFHCYVSLLEGISAILRFAVPCGSVTARSALGNNGRPSSKYWNVRMFPKIIRPQKDLDWMVPIRTENESCPMDF